MDNVPENNSVSTNPIRRNKTGVQIHMIGFVLAPNKQEFKDFLESCGLKTSEWQWIDRSREWKSFIGKKPLVVKTPACSHRPDYVEVMKELRFHGAIFLEYKKMF